MFGFIPIDAVSSALRKCLTAVFCINLHYILTAFVVDLMFRNISNKVNL